MFDYEPPVPVVLGGGFAVCYWLADAVVAVSPAVDHAPLVAVGIVMVAGWSLSAGYASSATLREGTDLARRTATHALLWVVLFGGTALVVTWAVLALVEFAWPGAEPTTFWFGMILVATTALGAVAIAAGGVYRLAACRVRTPS